MIWVRLKQSKAGKITQMHAKGRKIVQNLGKPSQIAKSREKIYLSMKIDHKLTKMEQKLTTNERDKRVRINTEILPKQGTRSLERI